MFIRLVAGLLERKSRRSRARLICIFRLSEQGPVRKLAARKYSVKAFKAKSEKLQNIKKISAQSNPPPWQKNSFIVLVPGWGKRWRDERMGERQRRDGTPDLKHKQQLGQRVSLTMLSWLQEAVFRDRQVVFALNFEHWCARAASCLGSECVPLWGQKYFSARVQYQDSTKKMQWTKIY